MLAASLLAASLLGSPSSLDEPPTNVILIVADDLGWGDLGSYGQKKLATPHLDRLAESGMRFTHFYSGSTVCAPSRCVLMTGLDTGHCLIRGNGKVNLRPQDVTVAEVLQPKGYVSGMFGKWGIGHEDSTGLPTLQGFADFYGYLDQHHAHNYYPTFLIDGAKRVQLRNEIPKEGKWGQGVASKKLDYSHDLIVAQAFDFLEANKEKPFFLYLPVTIPHANNEAGRVGMEVPELGAFADRDWPEPQRALGAMVHRLDRDVGRIVQWLADNELTERTLILFTSDNGPHREGGNNPDFQDSNGPLRGIKRSLHDGGIRVPLIASQPGTVPAGSTSDHLAGFVDVLATLADVAGAEAPDNDGISFLPTLSGKPDERQQKHESLYWEFYEGKSAQAVRTHDWKAVRVPAFEGPIQLYAADDIGEDRDVAGEHPDVVQSMLELMRQHHTPSERWKVRARRKR